MHFENVRQRKGACYQRVNDGGQRRDVSAGDHSHGAGALYYLNDPGRFLGLDW
jgi:hypothetical protein